MNKEFLKWVEAVFSFIKGKNNEPSEEDYINFIDMDEEMAVAIAFEAWSREVWPLEMAKELEQERKERDAFINEQLELMMEYMGA